MKLGQLIQEYRREHRYSLRQFADKCGVSFAQIRLMERGLNTMGKPLTPSIKSLKAVANGMGISLTALLEYCDDMTVEWEADDVSISEEKQALIDTILKATPEQVSKIKSVIDIVMPS